MYYLRTVEDVLKKVYVTKQTFECYIVQYIIQIIRYTIYMFMYFQKLIYAQL